MVKITRYKEILLRHGAQPSDKTLKYLKSEGVILFGDNAKIAALAEKYQELSDRALSRGVDKDQLLFNPPSAPAPQLLPGKEDPPLYTATSQNEINTVRKLLLQGVDIDALSKFGSTSLHLAIRSGYEEIAELLIKSGANVSLQNFVGNYPLIMAANNPNITRFLLENGAFVDQKTPGYRRTALIYSKNVQVSKLLLDAGADINYESGYSDTALSYAAEDENLPLVEFLLEQGADASSTYNGGRKLFLDIAASNKLEVVKLFLDYVTQNELNEAYDLSVLLGNLELENILKQAGANYLYKEKLFDRAVETKSIEAVKRLLKEGMDAYLKTERGSDNLIRSFPYYAAFDSGYELTRLLLENGANVNPTRFDPEKKDVTPLIYAVGLYNETSYLIGILLKYGANVNDRNSIGETALYKAIAKPLVSGYGHWGKKGYKPEYKRYIDDSLKTIKLLLDYGADIDIETKNGSLKELVSAMKKSDNSVELRDREFIVNFAHEVDLLLDLYR